MTDSNVVVMTIDIDITELYFDVIKHTSTVLDQIILTQLTTAKHDPFYR